MTSHLSSCVTATAHISVVCDDSATITSFLHSHNLSSMRGCMKKLEESGRRTCVGADLSCPPPIDRPAGMADQSAVGTINRPLQFTSNFFIHSSEECNLCDI